ncbi:MAG: transposase [Candidatus Aenigmarchaeota archaeon]|nr:transposase [Candidatus Aenigmarchaeota archaeon]
MEETNLRKIKGEQIAQTCRIMRRERGGYIVPSQSGTGAYIVKYVNFQPICECKDYETRQVKCKHAWALELILNKQTNTDGSETITKTMKVTYGQDWSAYNQAQGKEKALFQKLLFDLCESIDNPKNEGRGKPLMPLSDMVFTSALKVYTTFSLRRFTTDMREAKENQYIEDVCSYSTISNYMRKPELTPLLIDLILKSARPLKAIETDFAVDSSGFGTSRFQRWFSFKYGKEIDSRIWLKAHLISGVKTNIVTGVKVTEAYSHDSKEFSDLVNTTARTFEINEVSADKAYSSRDNLEAVNDVGGTAYIPFKSNTTGKAGGSKLWKKLYGFYTFNREDFLQHYHKRSNSETVFHMVKSKFGEAVRSKEWTAQINEVLLKVLCHNICVVIQEMHELDIKVDYSV